MNASPAGQTLGATKKEGTGGLEAHYCTLQLSPSADLELIERAYWLLAFRYHDQGQKEALQRLNEAMSAVASALAGEGAVQGPAAVAIEPRPKVLAAFAREAWWLAATASSVSLGLGLAVGAVETAGGLRVLEDWRGVMVGGGAAGLGAVAALAVLAAAAPAIGRLLRSRVPQVVSLPDHYGALHLDPSASPEVVELAYSHLSKKYSLAGASDRLLAVEEAYRVLREPQLRVSYDAAQRAMTRTTPVQQAPAPAPTQEPRPSPPPAAPTPEVATGRARAERPRQAPAILPALARAAGQGARAAAWAMAARARGLWRVWRLVWSLIVGAAALGVHTMAPALRRVATALRRRPRARGAPRPATPAPTPARPTPSGLERLLGVRRRGAASVGVTTSAQAATVPQPTTPPTARLVVVEGPMAGRSFDLHPDAAITVGTDPNCEIVLEAPEGALPPQLARIWPREGRFMLHLLAPEVPASIQGRPLVWVILENGDLLELGPYRLRFEVVRRRP